MLPEMCFFSAFLLYFRSTQYETNDTRHALFEPPFFPSSSALYAENTLSFQQIFCIYYNKKKKLCQFHNKTIFFCFPILLPEYLSKPETHPVFHIRALCTAHPDNKANFLNISQILKSPQRFVTKQKKLPPLFERTIGNSLFPGKLLYTASFPTRLFRPKDNGAFLSAAPDAPALLIYSLHYTPP